MSTARIAAKAATKKASEGTDPGEIALRLRGLGRLIEHAANSTGPDANPIDGEAGYFIERTLADLAARLGAR